MTEPRDDQLAAMLEARADRLPPAADREVMAAVRAEIRIPKGGALFSVVPVTRAHAMSGPAGWAAVGLVAVLVLAVMGGRLDSPPSAPTGSGPGSGSPAPSLDARGGPAATAMAPRATAITVAELRDGLDDGSLYGRIVLLTGSLKVTEFRCFTPQACGSIEIVGLEGVEVSDRWGTGSAEDLLALVDAHPGDSLMAFRVHVSDLELLGWITHGADAPLTVNGLLGQAGGLDTTELAVVSGWLTPASPGPSCPYVGESTTPCNAGPVLSDAPPAPDGTIVYAASVNVGLDGSVAFPSGQTVLSGRFLLESIVQFGGNPPSYRVVASLDHATTVRVVPASLTAAEEQLLRELEAKRLLLAVKDGSLDGRLIAITGWLQPSGAMCPADASQPCTLFVILGLGIGVTWDGPLSATSRLPGGQVLPPPPTAAGTLLVTPRDGHLVLLGRLIGNLEWPASIQELTDTDGRLLFPRMDPLALTSVAGWLVVDGTKSCRAPGPDAAPCHGPGPLLTDVEPSPDGLMTNDVHQQSVKVWPGAVGIDPAQVVTPGPFLYRIAINSPCASSAVLCARASTEWGEIMARYDIDTVYRVVVP